MKAAWARLEAALNTIDSKLVERLGPPATVAQIQACENQLGLQFPTQFRESLLIHGGEPLVPVPGGANFTTQGVFQQVQMLTPQMIESEWRVWKDDIGTWKNEAAALGPVKPIWWSPKWVPFTVVNGSTYHHCLDLDPAAGGAHGQVIEIGMKEENRIVVAASIHEFIENLASDIEAGAFEFDGDVLNLTEDAAEDRTLGGCKTKWGSG